MVDLLSVHSSNSDNGSIIPRPDQTLADEDLWVKWHHENTGKIQLDVISRIHWHLAAQFLTEFPQVFHKYYMALRKKDAPRHYQRFMDTPVWEIRRSLGDDISHCCTIRAKNWE